MTQRYVTVDANGVATAFYADDAGAKPPAGAIQISDGVYQSWIGNTMTQAWVGGQLVPYVPPPPPNPVVIASMAYFARFNLDETAAIHTAALSSPPTAGSLQLFNYLLLVAANGSVNLTDPMVVQGHQDLVGLGLLTADRSAAILTP